MENKKIERMPIVGGLVISKIEAAERQLRTAIWLWFHDFDPVPIHALAAAALKVLWKLHDRHKTGYKTLRDRMLDNVRDEYQRAFIETLNETENFIKHADRDPHAFHQFSPEMTVLVLIDAVESLLAFNGSFPIESNAFRTWFLINYPNLVDLPGPQLETAIKAMRAMRFSNKADFYKQFGEATRLQNEQAAKMPHP